MDCSFLTYGETDAEAGCMLSFQRKMQIQQQLDQEILQRREELQALETKLSMIKTDFDQKEALYLDRLFKLTSRTKNFETSIDEQLKKEDELNQRAKEREKREKELRIFAKKLEQQSEELLAQKVDYSLKAELYNKMLKRLSEEASERREELSGNANLSFIYQDDKMKKLEEQYILKLRNLEAKQNTLDEERRISESKLRDLVKREGDLAEREMLCQEKLNELRKTAGTDKSSHAEQILENVVKQKSEEIELLKEKINQYENNENMEIKIMGMKMNEEIQRKKIELEVKYLKEEWEKVIERESSLSKREKILEKRYDELNKKNHPPRPSGTRKNCSSVGRIIVDRDTHKTSSGSNSHVSENN